MISPALIWFFIGIALLAAEMALPSFIVFFFGIGALLTSLLVYLGVLDSVLAQTIVFGVSSLIILGGLRRYLKAWFGGKFTEDSESVEDEFIGKIVTVVATIPGGPNTGKVELKGAEWIARADDNINEGARVKVLSRDGLTLFVSPLS